MKILAIGDFHGRFPEKLKREVLKVDYILSTGDFANSDTIRKITFKNWDRKWYEVVGLKRAAKIERESFISGLKVMGELNMLKRKVYSVWGNCDFYREYTTSEPPALMPGFYDDKIKRMKNFKLIERKKVRVGDVELIGHGGYVDVTEYIRHPISRDKKKRRKMEKRYGRDTAMLIKLFRKQKPAKGFILLTHYTPLNCLDKVRFKGSPMNGKHLGFEPYNQLIKKYKPALVLCGHIHENQGKCRIGSSLVVNIGAASEGQAAMIEFDSKNRKVVGVKFIR